MAGSCALDTGTKPKDRRRTMSGVSTGARYLEADGRTRLMRRMRDLAASLTLDLGGDLSEAQTILVRRAASLTAQLEELEAAAARGSTFDLEAYNGTVNTLRRVLVSLGPRKAAGRAPTLGELMREGAPRTAAE